MLNQKLTGASSAANYIEDVFSTYLYTGNASTQTITNNIDLSTKGGLVWLKVRSGTTGSHELYDTVRGATKGLSTDTTTQELTYSTGLTAFSTTGFSLGSYSEINGSGNGMASWTFRKQPKFFDVVTYTGTGSPQNIAHSLGSIPGCFIVKSLDAAGHWWVYHRSLGATQSVTLSTTNAASTSTTFWNDTAPTSTQFTVGSGNPNNAGTNYVAYLFAHDAGGFGLTGTDNVISCGSFTTDGSGNATVNLGYEPQWVLVKRTDSSIAGSWHLIDTMRGWDMGSSDEYLYANTSDSTVTAQRGNPTATGFNAAFAFSASYIYIAIRRGPMKVPTDGTTVFKPYTYTTPTYQDTGTAIDSVLVLDAQTPNVGLWGNRLIGTPPTLDPRSTNAETSGYSYAYQQGQGTTYYPSGIFGEKTASYGWSRAPSFFDVVCYTGDGTAGRTIYHNLGVPPELIITKQRNAAEEWWTVGNITSSGFNQYRLNGTDAGSANVYASGIIKSQPTATSYTVNSWTSINGSGSTYVNYLFATCPGVSKVGSYTGNGSSQTINCGFTGGARFILIKRTDSTGDWYVWDTARGIVSGNDPHLSLNTTSAEVTTDDTIDTDSTGFVVNQLSATNVNVSSATYIYLAIA